MFSEKDVVDFPVSPYAATKKSCELMAHTYSHLYGLNIAGLRFFTVYGPRGRPDMAPYKVCMQSLQFVALCFLFLVSSVSPAFVDRHVKKASSMSCDGTFRAISHMIRSLLCWCFVFLLRRRLLDSGAACTRALCPPVLVWGYDTEHGSSFPFDMSHQQPWESSAHHLYRTRRHRQFFRTPALTYLAPPPFPRNLFPTGLPTQFIDLVARGQEIMQFGDGSTSRDYTYISDIVDGVVRSLDRPAGYQIYNLGNGSPVSLSSFIKLVEKSVGTPAKIRVCPEQPGDVPRTCADISKARSMLGYSPQVPFADGIHRTVDWYQKRAAARAAAAAGGVTVVADNEPLAVEFLPLRSSQGGGRVDRGRSVSCASASALDQDFCDSILPKAITQQQQQQPAAPEVALERSTRTMSYAF